MKYVVLSADGDRMVYLVPDAVAEDLERYCMDFCDKWLWESPEAARYRTGRVVCYNEGDFIEYLNRWIFPEEPSRLVEDLGWIEFDQPLPPPYQDCPSFNF